MLFGVCLEQLDVSRIPAVEAKCCLHLSVMLSCLV